MKNLDKKVVLFFSIVLASFIFVACSDRDNTNKTSVAPKTSNISSPSPKEMDEKAIPETTQNNDPILNSNSNSQWKQKLEDVLEKGKTGSSKAKNWLSEEFAGKTILPAEGLTFSQANTGQKVDNVFFVISPLGFGTRIYFGDSQGKKIKGLTYSSEQFAWADEYSFVKIIAKKPAKTDYTYTEGYLNLLPNDRYYVLAKLRFGDRITYRPVPVTYEEFLRLKNSEVGTSFQPLK